MIREFAEHKIIKKLVSVNVFNFLNEEIKRGEILKEMLVCDIFRNLLAIYIIMLVFSFISPGYVEFYIDLNMLLYPLIVLGAASLLFYAERLERSDSARFDEVKKRISYAFLGLLLIVAVQSFAPEPWQEWGRTPLMVAAVAFGAITFYLNRDKLGEIEEEARQEEMKEKWREMEFAGRYPSINRVWGVRWVARWIYGEGKYILWLLAIFLVFLFIQIYKIYNSEIGTDEGNILYTVKLISNGNILYLDFWARESGSLFFLLPWFKLFEISIINLRWFVLIINSIIFFLFYFFMKEISNNKKKILILLLISIIILNFNGIFEVYHGIFYILATLFTLTILYYCFKYYFNEARFKYITLIGLLTGFSVLVYKGEQILFVLVPIVIFLKSREDWKNYLKDISLFFPLAGIPIFAYWIYYSTKTDFNHIYQIILGDVINNFLLTSLLSLTGVLLILLMNIEKVKLHDEHQSIILLTNVFIVLCFIYRFFENADILYFSYYGGLILNYGFLIMILQLLNILVCKRFNKCLIFIYTIINLFILWQGFGSRGFFTKVPETYHVIATTLFILYSLFLVSFLFNKKYFIENEKNQNLLFYFTVILNIYFAISFTGGYLMPTRFQSLLFLLPILLLLLNLLRFPKVMKSIAYLLIISSLIFTFFLNINLSNDYTIYPLESINQIKEYVTGNTNSNDYIFTGDTALAAEIERKNILFLSSPWIYRKTNDVFYSYDEMRTKYPYDISASKEDIYQKIITLKPKYIFGNGRLNFVTFFDSDFDKNNTNLKKILDQNYNQTKRIDSIIIYEIK